MKLQVIVDWVSRFYLTSEDDGDYERGLAILEGLNIKALEVDKETGRALSAFFSSQFIGEDFYYLDDEFLYLYTPKLEK